MSLTNTKEEILMKKSFKHNTYYIKFSGIAKEDIFSILLLAAGTLLFVFFLTANNRMFGSQVDWVSQHSVLPEYFRQQFYKTGNLLPEFAAHLGGGQNIFHFSYYGLLSPVILVSYLFPWVSMTSYIAASSVILLLASGALCYCWLRRHQISWPCALAASALFQFSAALLYHSHKQIMFVNYMPFLLLALLGTDLYFQKKRSGLMMAGIFLMAMTSYFYSIGGLLALTVYGVYCYFHQYPKAGVKNFFLSGAAFALRLIIPIGISAILLLPSLYAISSGRSGETSKPALSALLVPKFNLLNVLYSPYGIGLTAISLLALFRLISRNRAGERVLFAMLAVLFSIPFFLYLLNGGLYLRGKVFIPFLPVLILITAKYLEENREYCSPRPLPDQSLPSLNAAGAQKCFCIRHEMIKAAVICLLLLPLDRSPAWLGFAAECILVIGGLHLGIKNKRFFLCCLPSVLVCLCVCIAVNLSDPLVPKAFAETMYAKEKQELLQELAAEDRTTYRFNDFTETDASVNLSPSPDSYRTSLYSSTYDDDYNEFHSNIMGNAKSASNSIACRDSSNILFQTFMGVKYILSENSAPAGYDMIGQNGPYRLYENPDVFPLAWGSASLMGGEEFSALTGAEQSAALLNYIIVDDAPKTQYTSPLKQENINLPFQKKEDGSGLNMALEKDTSISLPLSQPLNEQLLLLSFSFEEVPLKDIVVGANGILNRLTGKKEMYPNENFDFRYVLSENTANRSLNLDFSAGNYSFSKPELSSMDYDLVRQAARSVTPLDDNGYHTDNEVLSGTIHMKEDGYFTASIPYDRGFTALVDGIPQTVEKVNTAFTGFPLSQGTHEIQLIYHSPMLAEGKFVSYIFLILFFTVLVIEQARHLNSLIPAPEKGKKRIPYPAPVLTMNDCR